MSDLPLSVEVYRPWPSEEPPATLEINALVSEASWESQLPGGFLAGRLGFAPPGEAARSRHGRLTTPIVVEPDSRLVFRVGNQIVYEGVALDPAADGTAVESQGYGVWAPNWSPLRWGMTGQVTSGQLVRAAVDACPWLVLDRLEDPGIYHEWSEYAASTAAVVLDAMAAESGYRWGVWAGRRLRFTAPPSGAADYELAPSPAQLAGLRWSTRDVVDAVQAIYTGADGVERATEWLYRPGADRASRYLKRQQLVVSAEGSAAMGLAQTHLARYGARRLVGTLTIAGRGVLPTPDGGTRPAHLARAGQTLALLGYGTVELTRVKVNWTSGTTELTLGEPLASSLPALLASATTSDRAYRARRDPLSGRRRG